MREKVRTEEAKKSRNNVLQKGDSADPTAGVSKEDLEMLQQNRELEGAVRVGRGAEGTAADAKVNLQHQSDQSYRLNQQIIEMRNRDVKHSDDLLNEINYNRRRNLGILYCIGLFLYLGGLYIVWSNLDAHGLAGNS